MSGELKLLKESLQILNEAKALKNVNFAFVKKHTPDEAPENEVKELHRIINEVIKELNKKGLETFEVSFTSNGMSRDNKLSMMGSSTFPDEPHIMSGFVHIGFTGGDYDKHISGKDSYSLGQHMDSFIDSKLNKKKLKYLSANADSVSIQISVGMKA